MENISHSIERWTFKCDTNYEKRREEQTKRVYEFFRTRNCSQLNEYFMVVQNHWFHRTTAPNVRTFSANAYFIRVKCFSQTTRPNKLLNEQTCWECVRRKYSVQLPYMHSTMAIMFFIIKTCYWVRFSIINDFLDISDPHNGDAPPHRRSQPSWHLMDVYSLFLDMPTTSPQTVSGCMSWHSYVYFIWEKRWKKILSKSKSTKTC